MKTSFTLPGLSMQCAAPAGISIFSPSLTMISRQSSVTFAVPATTICQRSPENVEIWTGWPTWTHGNQKHKNGPFDRVHKAPGLSFFRSLIFEFEGDIFPCPPYMKPPIHA